MVTLVRALQPKKANCPMLVMPADMVTLVRPLQPKKAYVPYVTASAIIYGEVIHKVRKEKQSAAYFLVKGISMILYGLLLELLSVWLVIEKNS
jgi:hypothetical protein